MSFSDSPVYFFARDGGAAEHFSVFARSLSQNGYKVEVYAAGPAGAKFQEHDISYKGFSEVPEGQEETVYDLARRCEGAKAVITDAGAEIDFRLQRALDEEARYVPRFVYVDNRERYVPGGYSENVGKVIPLANKVLFANADLEREPIYQTRQTEIVLPIRKRIGIGYFPLVQAEKLASNRANNQARLRAQFFTDTFFGTDITDRGQQILVYFGGNNTDYFHHAFPAFLDYISRAVKENIDLSNYIIVFQQHPGAGKAAPGRKENMDMAMFNNLAAECGSYKNSPHIIVSESQTGFMQIIADKALFWQTSMGPLLALAGVPTLQVGHKKYEDILVRKNICPAATSYQEFVRNISVKPDPLSPESKKELLRQLGCKENWYQILTSALEGSYVHADSREIPGKSIRIFTAIAVGVILIGFAASRIFR